MQWEDDTEMVPRYGEEGTARFAYGWGTVNSGCWLTSRWYRCRLCAEDGVTARDKVRDRERRRIARRARREDREDEKRFLRTMREMGEL